MNTFTDKTIYYAQMKSKQDMQSALKVCIPEFQLISPTFNSNLKGEEQVLIGMNRFYELFPDYKVNVDDVVGQKNKVLMTGKVSLTPNSDFLKTNIKFATAQCQFSANFTIENNMISKEIFVLDLLDLCLQSGWEIEKAAHFFNRK